MAQRGTAGSRSSKIARLPCKSVGWLVWDWLAGLASVALLCARVRRQGPGAICPALAPLEDEGLVTIAAEGGRRLASPPRRAGPT